MDVDCGYKCIKKHGGGVQWYLMQSKIFDSNVSFVLKSENFQIKSFNGQKHNFSFINQGKFFTFTNNAKDFNKIEIIS